LETLSVVVPLLLDWKVLLLFCGIETVTRILSNPEEAFEKVEGDEKQNVIDRGNELHSRTLSLIALVVAGVAIVLSQEKSPESALPGLTLLGLSAGFLMVSHQCRNLVRGCLFWHRIQERTLEYGALSMFGGLILLSQFYSEAKTATMILQASFIVVLLIRFKAVYKTTKGEYSKWEKRNPESSRITWFIKWLLEYLGNKAGLN
jgi:di/tricarboxylate transporter